MDEHPVDQVESMLKRFGWEKALPAKKELRDKPFYRNGTLHALIGPQWTTVYDNRTTPLRGLDSEKTDDLPAVRRLVESLMGVS